MRLVGFKLLSQERNITSVAVKNTDTVHTRMDNKVLLLTVRPAAAPHVLPP